MNPLTNALQLTNEIAFSNGISGGMTNSWVYDEAGNWRTGDGKCRLYNSDNELVGITISNAPVSIPVTVTGHVEPGPRSNKWYNTWAECRGVSARVGTNTGNFTLANVPVYPGTNQLLVTVTDVSGNVTQQVRNVSRPMEEIFLHDANGNLTNWVSGTTNWVYEWDWADRLTKVSSNGVAVLENWYDASSRRMAKTEVVHGQTRKWLCVCDGWDVIGVLSENDQVRETFTRGDGLVGDIGTLVAVAHHAGSGVAAGVYYTHHNRRGDVLATRSGATTAGAYSHCAFGSLRTESETDVCRFMFSSKDREASCGFSYYGYRFYAPRWQRWLNKDPVTDGGFQIVTQIPGGNGRAELNLYMFVHNNPINKFDARGLWPTIPGTPRIPGVDVSICPQLSNTKYCIVFHTPTSFPKHLCNWFKCAVEQYTRLAKACLKDDQGEWNEACHGLSLCYQYYW